LKNIKGPIILYIEGRCFVLSEFYFVSKYMHVFVPLKCTKVQIGEK